MGYQGRDLFSAENLDSLTVSFFRLRDYRVLLSIFLFQFSDLVDPTQSSPLSNRNSICGVPFRDDLCKVLTSLVRPDSSDPFDDIKLKNKSARIG